MSSTRVTIQGTIKPDGILELDELPQLPPGRVEVTLQTVSDPAPADPGWWEALQQIAKKQAARGYRGRTIEEMEADEAAQRAEDQEEEARWQRIWAQTTRSSGESS